MKDLPGVITCSYSLVIASSSPFLFGQTGLISLTDAGQLELFFKDFLDAKLLDGQFVRLVGHEILLMETDLLRQVDIDVPYHVPNFVMMQGKLTVS